MAISSGVAKHFAFAAIGGTNFPLTAGSVEQSATMSSSSFSVQIPMNFPGAYNALSAGQSGCTVSVESVAGAGVLIVGIIDKISIDYPSYGGGGVINISGRDQSAALHQKKSDESFVNRLTTDIVSDLAGRVGLGTNVTGGSGILAGKFVDQGYVKITDGISYAAVIHKCAEIDNANWFVSPTGGVLNYVLGNFTTSGSYSVNYAAGPPVRGDYLRLQITRNMEADAQIQSTVKSWVPKQKQENNYTATIGAGAAGAGGVVIEYKCHIPDLTQDHVIKYAQSIANQAARHAITVRCELVGDPSIRPDNALLVNGTGAFDQSYQIDKIHHRFGYGGYTMEITAKTPGSGRNAT